jgi:hypothetical protein
MRLGTPSGFQMIWPEPGASGGNGMSSRRQDARRHPCCRADSHRRQRWSCASGR